uniref:Phorbol-ester/DAG-type domain-containing protein n=1 Tax=Fagus sylvatica TaxID=28930 RepID=A0A2N9GE35_FAGSY
MVQITTNMGKTHTSHPEHELELKNYRKPYTCDGCKGHGFGKRYRCEQCDYDLHEDCMFTTPTTSHKFFRNSTFKFYEQPPRKCNKQYCDAEAAPRVGLEYSGRAVRRAALRLQMSASLRVASLSAASLRLRLTASGSLRAACTARGPWRWLGCSSFSSDLLADRGGPVVSR